MKIKRNAIRCNKCKDIIESKHRHDFKYCDCQAVAVDGGVDYLRRLGEPADYEELSESVEDDVFLWATYNKKTREMDRVQLSEIDDDHLRNIDLHLRVRYKNSQVLQQVRKENDEAIRAAAITPEMEKRGLEPVDEEIPW